MAQLAACDGLIPLTSPEVRRLIYRLAVRVLAPPQANLPWSRWRRLLPQPVRCAATTGAVVTPKAAGSEPGRSTAKLLWV